MKKIKDQAAGAIAAALVLVALAALVLAAIEESYQEREAAYKQHVVGQ